MSVDWGEAAPAAAAVCGGKAGASERRAHCQQDGGPWQAKQHQSRCSLGIQAVGHGISYCRPDIQALVAAAAAEAEAHHAAAAAANCAGTCLRGFTQANGLFVAVCGPHGMVQATRKAVAEVRRDSTVASIGFHCEEPEW